MKGVGTFRVNGEESDRLLKKKPSQVGQYPACCCLEASPGVYRRRALRLYCARRPLHHAVKGGTQDTWICSSLPLSS